MFTASSFTQAQRAMQTQINALADAAYKSIGKGISSLAPKLRGMVDDRRMLDLLRTTIGVNGQKFDNLGRTLVDVKTNLSFMNNQRRDAEQAIKNITSNHTSRVRTLQKEMKDPKLTNRQRGNRAGQIKKVDAEYKKIMGSTSKLLEGINKGIQALNTKEAALLQQSKAQKLMRDMTYRVGGVSGNPLQGLERWRELSSVAGSVRAALALFGGALIRLVGMIVNTYPIFRQAGYEGGQAANAMIKQNVPDLAQALKLGVAATPEQMAKNRAAMSEEYMTTNTPSSKVARMSTLVKSGMGEGEAAGLYGTLDRLNGFNEKVTAIQLESEKSWMRLHNIPVGAGLREMAKNTELFAKYSRVGTDNLAKAALKSKQIGVDFSKYDQMIDKVVGDFEQSLTDQANLQTFLPQANLSGIQMAAYSNDPDAMRKAVKELADSLGGTEGLKNMNGFQRRALQQYLSPLTNLDISKIAAGEAPEQTVEDKEAGKKSEFTANVETSFGDIVFEGDLLKKAFAALTTSALLAATGLGGVGLRGMFGGAGGVGGATTLGSRILGGATSAIRIGGGLVAGGMAGYDQWQDARGRGKGKAEAGKEALIRGGLTGAFTYAGAALGSLIPIPVVGTALGAAGGAWLGNKLGNEFYDHKNANDKSSKDSAFESALATARKLKPTTPLSTNAVVPDKDYGDPIHNMFASMAGMDRSKLVPPEQRNFESEKSWMRLHNIPVGAGLHEMAKNIDVSKINSASMAGDPAAMEAAIRDAIKSVGGQQMNPIQRNALSKYLGMDSADLAKIAAGQELLETANKKAKTTTDATTKAINTLGVAANDASKKMKGGKPGDLTGDEHRGALDFLTRASNAIDNAWMTMNNTGMAMIHSVGSLLGIGQNKGAVSVTPSKQTIPAIAPVDAVKRVPMPFPSSKGATGVPVFAPSDATRQKPIPQITGKSKPEVIQTTAQADATAKVALKKGGTVSAENNPWIKLTPVAGASKVVPTPVAVPMPTPAPVSKAAVAQGKVTILGASPGYSADPKKNTSSSPSYPNTILPGIKVTPSSTKVPAINNVKPPTLLMNPPTIALPTKAEPFNPLKRISDLFKGSKSSLVPLKNVAPGMLYDLPKGSSPINQAGIGGIADLFKGVKSVGDLKARTGKTLGGLLGNASGSTLGKMAGELMGKATGSVATTSQTITNKAGNFLSGLFGGKKTAAGNTVATSVTNIGQSISQTVGGFISGLFGGKKTANNGTSISGTLAGVKRSVGSSLGGFLGGVLGKKAGDVTGKLSGMVSGIFGKGTTGGKILSTILNPGPRGGLAGIVNMGVGKLKTMSIPKLDGLLGNLKNAATSKITGLFGGKLLGGMGATRIGGMIGSAIPGAGTLIGSGLGFLSSKLMNSKLGGMFGGAISSVSNVLGKSPIGSVFKNAGTLGSTVSSKVSGAVKSIGSTIGGWFGRKKKTEQAPQTNPAPPELQPQMRTAPSMLESALVNRIPQPPQRQTAQPITATLDTSRLETKLDALINIMGKMTVKVDLDGKKVGEGILEANSRG